MEDLRFSASVTVACPPAKLYDLISDVTRTGEWSPTCTACWWDEGHGPTVGSWFTGRNETPQRVWETRSQVLAAEVGREFTFAVGGQWVRWSYTLQPEGSATRLTQSWAFLPAGVERFHQRYGQRAQAEITQRTEAAHHDIPATLAAIKEIAEGRAPVGR